MKLPSSVAAITIFLLLTTAEFDIVARNNPTAAIDLASIPSTIGTRELSQGVSLDPSDPSLDVRPPKKPKKPVPPKEPETCSRNSECFWNHRCVDGVCVVGCQDLKDCKPPQKCFQGYCHWKVSKHARPRRCQANKQNCLRNYHCCYYRCVLPKTLNTNTGIFGYCYKVPRGEDGPPGDEWGDMRPDYGDMEELVDRSDTATAMARFKGRGLDLEKRNTGLERRDLIAEAREFELENGGEDQDEEDLDYELIEKGKAAYWGEH